MTCGLEVGWCERMIAREKVSVVESLEEGVAGGTLPCARNVRDCLANDFEENGTVGEGADYVGLGRICGENGRPVLGMNFCCDDCSE